MHLRIGEISDGTREIRLELARIPEFPEGGSKRCYEFVAPLTDDGHLDAQGWHAQRSTCTVHRFWAGEDDGYGHLVHHRGHHWAFHYHDMDDEEEEEPIFRFDRHRFAIGDYV